jgi:hypothetical protein
MVHVNSSHTVFNVKQKIQSCTRIKPGNQHIYYVDNTELEDNRTLSSYQIQVETVLHLGYQVFVRKLDRTHITLDVVSLETIESVKKKLFHELGIPTERQNLSYCGKPLEPFHTLAYYGASKEARLMLSIPGALVGGT